MLFAFSPPVPSSCMALETFMAKELALTTAAAFAGAAIFVSVAEQPARLGIDDRALLAEWKLSYARGFAMQASLALASALIRAVGILGSGATGARFSARR